MVASYYLLGLPIAWLLAWPEHLATLGLALGALVGTAANLLGFLWWLGGKRKTILPTNSTGKASVVICGPVPAPASC